MQKESESGRGTSSRRLMWVVIALAAIGSSIAIGYVLPHSLSSHPTVPAVSSTNSEPHDAPKTQAKESNATQSRSEVASMRKWAQGDEGKDQDCYSYPIPLTGIESSPEARDAKASQLSGDIRSSGIQVTAMGLHHEYLLFEASPENLSTMRALAKDVLDKPEDLVGMCGEGFLEVQFIIRDGFKQTMVARHTLTHHDFLKAVVASSPMQ